MKVTIDVPDKYFEIAKGMMLGSDLGEENEHYLNDAINKIKEISEKGEPMHVRIERLKCGEADSRQLYTQVMLAVAVMALGEWLEE